MDVYETATKILGCVVGQLNEEGRPVDIDIVLPGANNFKVGMGECSQAWVRLVTALPSNTPGQQISEPGNCAQGLGVRFDVGVMRCWDAPDEDEEPDPAELRRVADLALKDMLSIRVALTCCDAYRAKDMLLESYTPMGPAIMDVGGYWTMSLALL